MIRHDMACQDSHLSFPGEPFLAEAFCFGFFLTDLELLHFRLDSSSYLQQDRLIFDIIALQPTLD